MARITLGDLQPRRRPFEPADPSRDTFDQRFRPNDPVREYLDQQRGLRPVRPGTQERFGDPSKVISQGTPPPLSVPPSLGMPMPRTAQLAGRTASDAPPVGAPPGPSGAPTTNDYEVVQGPLSEADYGPQVGGRTKSNVASGYPPLPSGPTAVTEGQAAAAQRMRQAAAPAGGREMGAFSAAAAQQPNVGMDAMGLWNKIPDSMKVELLKMIRGPQ